MNFSIRMTGVLRRCCRHSLYQSNLSPITAALRCRRTFKPCVLSRQGRADQEAEMFLHKGSNIGVTRGLMMCLKPRTWLNDEVMNLVMAMLLVNPLASLSRFCQSLCSHACTGSPMNCRLNLFFKSQGLPVQLVLVHICHHQFLP